jgi:hypothetical protein
MVPFANAGACDRSESVDLLGSVVIPVALRALCRGRVMCQAPALTLPS